MSDYVNIEIKSERWFQTWLFSKAHGSNRKPTYKYFSNRKWILPLHTMKNYHIIDGDDISIRGQVKGILSIRAAFADTPYIFI